MKCRQNIELSLAAVYQHQVRPRDFLPEQPCDHFFHHGIIIGLVAGPNPEATVAGFVRLALFKDHPRPDCRLPLNIGDIQGPNGIGKAF